MAVVVNANERVVANLTIRNDGQSIGTFRLKGQIRKTGESAVQGNFFNKSNINAVSNPPVATDFYVDSKFNPNEQKTLTMYTANWANGNPLAFDSQQLFDVTWTVEVLETGETAIYQDSKALQHQMLTNALADITMAQYSIA